MVKQAKVYFTFANHVQLKLYNTVETRMYYWAMKIQKILFAFLAVYLFATMTWGQNINDENKSSSSFFEISGGIGVNTPMQFTQIGTAHKRGDFNEFDTDFDLNVFVSGECKAVTNYGVNISANQLRQNQKGKWNFGC